MECHTQKRVGDTSVTGTNLQHRELILVKSEIWMPQLPNGVMK